LGASRRRTRLALVGPLPPTLSGVATFNARLIEPLAQRCLLDLFTARGDRTALEEEHPNVRVFEYAALGSSANPHSYDAIVYTVGNNDQHHEVYDLASRFPGLVWLHDARLWGFFWSYLATRFPERTGQVFREKLGEWYGDRVPAETWQAAGLLAARESSLGFTRGWVANARGVLVNSAFAARLLRLDQGPSRHLPPIHQLFLAVPELPPTSETAKSPGPLLASFGIVDSTKAPSLLIDLLPLVRQRVPAELVFVGPISEYTRRELRERAERSGVAGAVRSTGYVEEQEYRRWLQRVWCALQLRWQATGESSAAIGDCLGAGVPVITNLADAREAYPASCLLAIPPGLRPETLVGSIVELLEDEHLRERYSLAARCYAAEHSFERLAERLLAIVEDR
jgi:glycosyltransferase involved in cell wall biosynthesis